ncbi:uncharacterized protein LOC135836274 [Planococcus citri]|uniref:uncharacterized protein LOC135836274 n=1 Tax=Planococcus citri TaxID=170843 RepID=UPI0031FA3740
MTETSDRLWKKPQNVEEFAKSTATVQNPKQTEDNTVSDTWTELSSHPSWNNLFLLLENYINRCNKLEKKSRRKSSADHETTVKKVSIRKKYKKYKKRYHKLIKNETSRTSDSGYERTPKSEKPTEFNDSN